MQCPKCGAEGAVKNGSGRGTCPTGNHSFKLPPASLTQPDNLPEGLKLRGTSTLTDVRTGETVMQWVKTTADEEARKRIFLAEAKAMADALPKVARRKAEGSWRKDLLTVYPIGDPHIGMYSWGEETGENWDLPAAERVHCGAMAALVASAPASEQALLLNLGDALHYDSLAAVTPRSGHMLDADGRYAKMAAVAVKVIRQCIESALTRHKRVHVINLPGNHDETGALWLSIALHHIYEREPRVTVDLSPALFCYYRWGKVLLGAHHGHTCKPDKLPGVMACDRAKDWGETTHRHWLMGHIHTESKREFAGVTVESFNTLAAKDAYATNGGWRSGRTMQALVFHKEHGEVARSKVNAAMFEEAA